MVDSEINPDDEPFVMMDVRNHPEIDVVDLVRDLRQKEISVSGYYPGRGLIEIKWQSSLPRVHRDLEGLSQLLMMYPELEFDPRSRSEFGGTDWDSASKHDGREMLRMEGS